MLVFGTQMHIVTFGFVCVEILILFYLVIHRLARPDDKISLMDIFLIALLIVYNVTGGLLPDPKLPGSFFIQESIAYGTGFITPCYFPYYVYKAFGLEKMRFHAYKGVTFFLIVPYLLFVTVFAISGNLEEAKNILIVPVMYGLWVLFSLNRAIRFKYQKNFSSGKYRVEIITLFFSLTPWIGLPFITYFDLNQAVEAITTNTGFLLLLALHLKQNVQQLKEEHQRLINSEQQLLTYNERVQEEVNKRTKELESMSAEERLVENCKLYRLTNREREIASLICKGFTHKQIGETLFIADRTVAKHTQNIFEKARVNNKMELCKKLEA